MKNVTPDWLRAKYNSTTLNTNNAIQKRAVARTSNFGRSEGGNLSQVSGEAQSSPPGRSTAIDVNGAKANNSKTTTGRQQYQHQQQQHRNRETIYLKKGLKAARSSLAGSPLSTSASSASSASALTSRLGFRYKSKLECSFKWWRLTSDALLMALPALANLLWLRRGEFLLLETGCQMALAWLVLLLLFWP